VGLFERIERLPVEEWAAAVGGLARRIRRRLARRRGALVGVVASGLLVFAVAGNALFGQSGPHPAPIWGPEDPPVAVATHGAADSPRQKTEASPLVAEVQAGLSEQGYFDGLATGVLDAGTRAAIAAFERAQGLPETGEPSVALLAAVSDETRAAPRPDPAPRLSVAQIQRLLNEQGFGPLEEDGLMGPRTREALERFARAEGLDPSAPGSPAIMRALAGGDA